MTRRFGRLALLLLLAAGPLHAQAEAGSLPPPIVLMVILGAISFGPFIAIMMTSFVKVSIVLSMVKSALQTQVPSGMVTSGLSLVLTIFIMAPVAQKMYDRSGLVNRAGGVFAIDNLTTLYNAVDQAKEPLRDFLLKHAHVEDRVLFVGLAQRLEQSAGQPAASPAENQRRPDEEFRVILPAFVTSELKGAFQIAFLVLLPFVVVDVVVANITVALGLQMLQPSVVSLPIKLLLLVVADGWYLIVKGLVLSYT
jgi:type III secretion protein R